MTELERECAKTLGKGSKSFDFAARLFPANLRRAARLLYAWCRHCDDRVDEAPDPEEARRALALLRAQTRAALHGGTGHGLAFCALQTVVIENAVPRVYPGELLLGMQMDVDGIRYQSLQDLELYCHRVASVVGLMMTHAMGASSRAALELAARAGMAMQMSNIARDIAADFALGRVYVPEDWFRALGIAPPRPGVDAFEARHFVAPVHRLLLVAESHYQAGRRGLSYLPLRAAIAVGAALEIYREIGRVVLKRGAFAWEQRAVVSQPRKFWLALRGASRALRAVFGARVWRGSGPSVPLGKVYEFKPFGEQTPVSHAEDRFRPGLATRR